MIKKLYKNIFVTVGTTEFEELVRTVTSADVLQQLADLGCQTLTIQFGRGTEPASSSVQKLSTKINLECYGLKSSIGEDIQRADLIISHAGAGSCIEVLEAGKPLVVVVNDTLMNNHQTELAERLSKDGCLFYCTPKTLQRTLQEANFDELKAIAPASLDGFVNYLDKFMGFR